MRRRQTKRNAHEDTSAPYILRQASHPYIHPSATTNPAAVPVQVPWTSLYYTPDMMLLSSLAMYQSLSPPSQNTTHVPQTSTPKASVHTSEGDTASCSSPEGTTSSSHTATSDSAPASENNKNNEQEHPVNLTFKPKRPWEDDNDTEVKTCGENLSSSKINVNMSGAGLPCDVNYYYSSMYNRLNSQVNMHHIAPYVIPMASHYWPY